MDPPPHATSRERSVEVLDALAEAARSVELETTEGGALVLRRWRVAAGEVVTEAGSPAIEVHVVAAGTVELRRAGDPRRAVISVLGPGGVFGDVPEVLGRVHHLDAVAVGDTDLVSLRADQLTKLLAMSSRLALAWTTSLAERVLETHERLGELLAGHLDHRVAAVLLRRIDDDGRVDLTQEAMARLLGVQRSSINDVIRRLELRGLVRRGYAHVVISDRDGLAALVSPPAG